MTPRVTFRGANWTHVSAKEIDEIGSSKWRLDCTTMVLRSGASSHPARLSGPGTIHQSQDGHIHFRLYASRERNLDEWRAYDALRAGEIIPDTAYYTLVATDTSGRQWKCSRFIPSFDRGTTGKSIAFGVLPDIESRGRLPTSFSPRSSTLSLWVFDDVAIPCNANTTTTTSVARGTTRSKQGTRNAWRFRSLGIDFLIRRMHSTLLVVEASLLSGPLPLAFEDRLMEALEFVLGRTMVWTIMNVKRGRSQTVAVRELPRRAKGGRFQAPLPPQHLALNARGKYTTAFHRSLFERYLAHTVGHRGRHHALWGLLSAVREASAAAFLDAEALTVTVAIESLLHSEFPNLGHPTKSEKKAISKLKAYLQRWRGSQDLKDRVAGSIAQLTQSRAMDKMRKLATSGAITQRQLEAWQRLRNPTTHAYLRSGISSTELIDLVQQMEVLLYHLTFLAIGYRGPYMDFASPDWPTRTYEAPRRRKARRNVAA